jgi:lysophospholipase L1-like esterase
MFRNPRHVSLVVLFLVLLLANAVIGQSLAISQNSANKMSLEATSPADIGYRFQASPDFKNWEDISDQASGPLSYRIAPTNDAMRFFRLRAWTTQDAHITLVILGDSTVADFAVNNSQFSGWGQGIYGYLKPNVQVVNLAVAYQSTRVFLSSIQKEYLVKIKPDFVLVHFGWVDASGLPAPYPTSITEYEAYLKTIIQMIRDFKGTPILMTPTGPRVFDDTGKVVPSMEDRCEVVRNLAAEFQTYLIDLNQLSKNLYNELGDSKSAYISWNEFDRAHFSLKGAEVIAGLAVNAFPDILSSQVVKN